MPPELLRPAYRPGHMAHRDLRRLLHHKPPSANNRFKPTAFFHIAAADVRFPPFAASLPRAFRSAEKGGRQTLQPEENFRPENPSHLQRNLQTPAKSRKKIRLQMSNLDLLSEMPVVNRCGENGPTENGIWRPRPRRTQQPHRYNPRKQRDFSAERPNGERVWSGGWLGREDSNLRMTVPKTVALPLGDAPIAAVSRTTRRRLQGGRAVPGSPQCGRACSRDPVKPSGQPGKRGSPGSR